MNWQNVLNYSTILNDVHNINATAVQEYTYSGYEYTGAEAYSLSDPFFSNHIITGTFSEKSVDGYKTFNGLASYLLRANYNFSNKY